MVKIAVDVFGGDNAPVEIVKGCVDALNADAEITLVLVGRESVIKQLLDGQKYDASRVEILDAADVITNDDIPTAAIKQKPDSSLVKALKLTKEDDSVKAFVSAGSSGAVLTGALLIVGRIKGVLRPALAPILPTIDYKHVLLVDCGANVDCKPEYLAQFAVMGDSYMKSVYKLDAPRVALISNGTEDKKGNELCRQAFTILKQMPINFVGNMEARDALTGEYDVLVCDGFVGNVALKCMEGTSNLMFGALKQCIEDSFRAKIGAAIMKPALRKLKHRLDYTRMGGAPFLGCEKIVLKAHGSSKALTICSTILQAKGMCDGNLIESIRDGIQKVDLEKLINV